MKIFLIHFIAYYTCSILIKFLIKSSILFINQNLFILKDNIYTFLTVLIRRELHY
jgi:hypothetical protein